MPSYKIKYQEVVYREVTVRALDSYKAEEYVKDGLIKGPLTGKEAIQIVEVEEVTEDKRMATGLCDSNGEMIYVGEYVYHSKLGRLKVDYLNGAYQCISEDPNVKTRMLVRINCWCSRIK